MTTHIFIVDATTFKLHLEYLFAGTGSKDNFIDFNNKTETSLYHTAENTLVSMIADAYRVRRGDFVIFYLQQKLSEKIYEGKFYGIFKAKRDWSFLDNNNSGQYLKRELEKSLTFRTLIKPYKVYSEGVTEWEALDEIRSIRSPHQMLWSLIYRKLKGNRGNTMVTVYESERLCQLIRNKNRRETIDCTGKLFSFDSSSQKIICLNRPTKAYSGRKQVISILPRLLAKFEQGKSFEPHLQAYIVRNIGQGINRHLDEMILGDTSIEWIGNEVSCGVGMQRIDVMLSTKKNEQRICIPIELKSVEVTKSQNIKQQIQRYIDWIEQYYIPNRQSDIQPIIISKAVNNKASDSYRKIVDSFNEFNAENISRCYKLKYIEFHVDNGDLEFNEINYIA